MQKREVERDTDQPAALRVAQQDKGRQGDTAADQLHTQRPLHWVQAPRCQGRCAVGALRWSVLLRWRASAPAATACTRVSNRQEAQPPRPHPRCGSPHCTTGSMQCVRATLGYSTHAHTHTASGTHKIRMKRGCASPWGGRPPVTATLQTVVCARAGVPLSKIIQSKREAQRKEPQEGGYIHMRMTRAG